MNEKAAPTNNWAFPHPTRSCEFNYEEQCRNAGVMPQTFDTDAPVVPRTAAPVPIIQPFISRFGIPFCPELADYNHRIDELHRNPLFQFPAPVPNSALTQHFIMNTSVSNAISAIDAVHFPQFQSSFGPPPPMIEQPPRAEIPENHVEDAEKPPVLKPEYVEKQPEESRQPEFLTVPKREVVNVSPKLNNEELKKPRHFDEKDARDDFLFSHPFYQPGSIDLGDTNFMKSDVNHHLDGQLEYHRISSSLSVKRELSAQQLHFCQVCQSTHANGLHFGARTCAACAAFFRRTISDNKTYVCKRNSRCNNASRDGTGYRKICRACRMKRCIEIGMLPDNVQHKRTRRDVPEPPPHQKVPIETIFNGFYPSFPSGPHQIPLPPIQHHQT